MNSSLSQHESENMHVRPIFWLTFVLLCGVFLFTEHSLTASLVDTHGSTADDLELNAAGGSTTRRAAFLGMALFGVLMIMLPSRRQLRMGSGIGLCVCGYAAWAFLSITWSTDPAMTIRRCLAMGCLLMAACGVGKQLTSRELLRLGWMVPLACMVMGVAAEIAFGTFRPFSGEYRFSGTLHPNTQGLYLVSLCLAMFCVCRESRWKHIAPMAVLAVGFGFLVLTKSRTSTAGFLVAATLIFTLRTSSGLKWSVSFAGAWLICAAALTVLLLGMDVEDEVSQVALMGRQEQAESLTGRLPIWTELARYIGQRPLTGFGYDSFWSPDHIETISSEMQWGIREAHSAYLDTMLSVGLVGLIILITGISLGLRESSRRYLKTGNPFIGYLFGMFAYGLLHSFTESGMTMPMFVPFLLVCGLVTLTSQPEPANAPVRHRLPSLESHFHQRSFEALS
jgi:exopolysaccharide production protein ExoQ